MAVAKGEACFVLLINHPKLPDDRYFVEKEDGTSESDCALVTVTLDPFCLLVSFICSGFCQQNHLPKGQFA